VFQSDGLLYSVRCACQARSKCEAKPRHSPRLKFPVFFPAYVFNKFSTLKVMAASVSIRLKEEIIYMLNIWLTAQCSLLYPKFDSSASFKIVLRLENYPGYQTPRHHGSSQLSSTMRDEFHWSGAAVTVAYSTDVCYTSWLDDTSPFIVVIINIIGRLEKQESGFSRFPGFPTPPWGDLQTKANTFCLIRTTFNWKEW